VIDTLGFRAPGPAIVQVDETFDRCPTTPVEVAHPSSGFRTGGAVHAFLLSFGIIFAAELGDKSQLMALTLATRYRALRC
jgi:hypothetical protein